MSGLIGREEGEREGTGMRENALSPEVRFPLTKTSLPSGPVTEYLEYWLIKQSARFWNALTVA